SLVRGPALQRLVEGAGKTVKNGSVSEPKSAKSLDNNSKLSPNKTDTPQPSRRVLSRLDFSSHWSVKNDVQP
ncbi:MAG: hypothetical protein KI786_06250, partial [Mameliella sp.]|nr:hypothetical protein [Phaeodactylibacter sp.]